LDASQQKVSAI
jgi:hypothetical protein